MRTTLALDDDAFTAIRTFARDRGVSLGKAASELVRRGSHYRLGIRRVNGLPVFDVPEEFRLTSTEFVRDLSEDD